MNLRRLAPWAAGLFALWYLISSPEAAAHTVESAIGGLVAVADALATFVNTLGDE
jgi:hypothetical protein